MLTSILLTLAWVHSNKHHEKEIIKYEIEKSNNFSSGNMSDAIY